MPFVSAQNTFTEIVAYALGVNTQNSYLLLAFAVFVIILALLFKLSNKIFTESKNLSFIVALVIALVAVNFMPDDLYTYLAQYMVFLVVIAVILSPWVLVDYFGNIPRKWRHFILIIIYIIGIVLIKKLRNYATIDNLLSTEFPFLIFGDVSFGTLAYLALILAILISLYNLFKTSPSDLDAELERQRKQAETKQRSEDAKRLAAERKRLGKSPKEIEEAKEDSGEKYDREYARNKMILARKIGINNLTNRLESLQKELESGVENAKILHSDATRKDWNKPILDNGTGKYVENKKGREAYKEWYRQFNRNTNIQKEIREIKDRIDHLKKQI